MSESRTPLRLWPAVVIIVLQWIMVVGAPRIAPETMFHFIGGGFSPMFAVLALGIWWVFFSRATRGARWGGAGLFLVGFVGMLSLAHPSMGPALLTKALPWITTWVVALAAVATQVAPAMRRRLGVIGILLAFAPWLLLRTAPLDGSMRPDYSWRWSATAEERLLAAGGPIGLTATDAPDGELALAQGDWPGFRGPQRDAKVTGLRIKTDWEATPPIELWRRPVGPAWSSMAVVAGHVFTQEQRGEQELVAAYRAADGEPLWSDAIASRFFEPMAGAGPRATPTFADGRIYSVSAKGVVRCNDAASGRLIWSHDLMQELDAPLLDWAFAGSPAVVDGLAVVYAGNPDGRGLVAYDAISGERRWVAPTGSNSYSSPQLLTFHDVPQIVMLHSDGATGHDPASGAVLWKHDWPMPDRARMVQPLELGGNRLLVATSFGEGTRMLAVKFDGTSFSVDEVWTSRGMKPYYNDFADHDGHLYGFDTKFLASINLTGGERNWKRGRYGHGQLLMLTEQGLLLVLSEEGELALVEANPDDFVELARITVLDGRTWNHPVVVGDTIYVRNDQEMAAYRLPT